MNKNRQIIFLYLFLLFCCRFRLGSRHIGGSSCYVYHFAYTYYITIYYAKYKTIKLRSSDLTPICVSIKRRVVDYTRLEDEFAPLARFSFICFFSSLSLDLLLSAMIQLVSFTETKVCVAVWSSRWFSLPDRLLVVFSASSSAFVLFLVRIFFFGGGYCYPQAYSEQVTRGVWCALKWKWWWSMTMMHAACHYFADIFNWLNGAGRCAVYFVEIFCTISMFHVSWSMSFD